MICCSLTSPCFTADMDDLNICYLLRNQENATSDLFHFSVEDHGKTFTLPLGFPFLGFSAEGLKHAAK